MSRRHAPSFLCCAISRMVSIDSCFAESMNAHVFTTRTSAAAASCVSSWPACCVRPSITSESTRFLGQPSEMRPTFMFEGSRHHEGHQGHKVFSYRKTLCPLCPLWRRHGESRIKPVKHPRIRNCFAEVFQLADP